MKIKIEYLFVGSLLVFILLHEQCQSKDAYKENALLKNVTEVRHKLDSLQILLERCQSKHLDSIYVKS